MKKPKDELSKQEYSTLVVIICAILGCACLLIVVLTQPSSTLAEKLLSSVFIGGVGVFSLAMLLWYIAYLRAKRKYGIGREKDRNKWSYWSEDEYDVTETKKEEVDNIGLEQISDEDEEKS